MSDAHFLLLALVAIYAWDCLLWIPRGTLIFTSWLGQLFVPRFPAPYTGNTRGSLTLLPPLPPLGTTFLSSPPPLSVSSHGILGFTAASLDPAGRPPQSALWCPWDQLESLETRGRRILLNGRELCRVQGEAAANLLARRLRQLHKTPAPNRAAALQDWADSLFDTDAALQRLAEFRKSTHRVRLACNTYFVLLLVLTPAAILLLGPQRAWPYLLTLLLAQAIITAFLFQRAHKPLHPLAPDERFTHTLVTLLSPPSGVRALDALSRHALASFHPLTLALTLDTREARADFTARTLRELRYPALPTSPYSDPAIVDTEASWRSLLHAAAVEAIRRAGLNPDALTATPRPLDPTCRTWCPRCLQQFTLAEGHCRACGGLPLQPLTPPPPPGQQPDAGPGASKGG